MDLGASISAISQSTFDKIRNEIPISMIKPTREAPTQADKSKLSSIGETTFTLTIKGRSEKGEENLEIRGIRFSILRSLSYPIILGCDVIQNLGLQTMADSAVLIRGIKFITIDNSVVNSCHAEVLNESSFNYGDEQFRVTQITVPMPPLDSVSQMLTLCEITCGCHYEPRTCVFSFTEGELETQCEDKMFLYSIHSLADSCNLNTVPNVKFTSCQSVKTGKFNLTNITRPVTSKGRTLISYDFYKPLVNKSKLTADGKTRLSQILIEMRPLFSASQTDVGIYRDELVNIQLKNDSDVVPYQKPRPIPWAARDFVKSKVNELISAGIFERTKGSQTNSPCHIVMTKKANGEKKFRLTVDYSTLNKFLVPNIYPLPRIRTIINDLAGSRFFSSIDLRHGFWNIQLDPKCQELLAFSIGQEQLQPTRLPMGLACSPSIFQRIMIQIMQDFLNNFVHVYLDDVIIYSKDEATHLDHIALVLKAFQKSGILLNADKCAFGQTEMKYLGFLVSDKGWQVLPERVKSIQNFVAPRNTKELKRFIGMCSYITSACPLLQFELHELHNVSGKNKFKWGKVQQDCFSRIKQIITNSIIMSYPSDNPAHKLILTTDASDSGWGGVLSQLDSFGVERPLGFTSGTFRDSALNYDIRNKEMTAFVRSLEYFCEYLWSNQFIWRTDNRCLKFLSSSLKDSNLRKNQRILRNIEFINEFSFSIELIKGTSGKMSMADYLSRMYPVPELKCPVSSISEIDVTKFWTRDVDFTLSELSTAQEQDLDIVNYKTSKNWRFMRNKGLKVYLENGIYKAKFRNSNNVLIVVPSSLEETLINTHHVTTHARPKQLYEEIKELFIFPNMFNKIESHVKKCLICVSLKPDKTAKLSMTKSSTPTHPWSCISADLLGPFSMSETGNKYILTIICLMTRFTILRPIKNKEAETVIDAFNKLFMEYGPCINLMTDNGKEFVNGRMAIFLDGLKIAHNKSTPYRPRSNGAVERVNQKIIKFMRIFLTSDTTWDEDLPMIQFTINNEYNRNLGRSSWESWHGWRPILPSLLTFPKSKLKSEKDMNDFTIAARVRKQRIALAQLYLTEESRKANSHSDVVDLPVNTKVLMKTERKPGSSKLFQSWKGPFVVKKKLDNDSYLISGDNDYRKGYIVYRGRLKVVGKLPNDEKIPSKVEEEGEKDMKRNVNPVTPVKDKTKPTLKSTYSLRNRNNIDYGEFM